MIIHTINHHHNHVKADEKFVCLMNIGLETMQLTKKLIKYVFSNNRMQITALFHTVSTFHAQFKATLLHLFKIYFLQTNNSAIN